LVALGCLGGCDLDDALPCRVPGVVLHYVGSMEWVVSTDPLPVDAPFGPAGAAPACASGAAAAEVQIMDYYPFAAWPLDGCYDRFSVRLVSSAAAECTLVVQPTDVVLDRGRGPLDGVTATIADSPCTLVLDGTLSSLRAQVGTLGLAPATLDLVFAGPTDGSPTVGGCGAGYARVSFTGNRGRTDPPPP
jgi:hypothetical protein